MLCPLCQTEMRISRSVYRLKNIDPPEMVIAHDLVCRSKKCPNYDKVVKTIENPVEVEVYQPS
jgi:hypothetical protein